jgi:SAM-dependent methyltransferase
MTYFQNLNFLKINKIPWWGKILTKLLLSRLPFGYSVWQRLGLFRHGDMDSSDYAIQVFNSHLNKSGFVGMLKGKTVLELGPGDSIATAIIAAAHGAQAILLDTGAFARLEVVPYFALLRDLRERGLTVPNLEGCTNLEMILERCNARYLIKGLESFEDIPDNSVDLIFSQAVLEHVRKKDFFSTQIECRRVLKPNGICSHQVDLRDHLGGGLNNLRFTSKVWESDFFSKSGFYTNRIGCGEMIDICHKAKFTVDVHILSKWDSLPIARKELSNEFKSICDAELCISIFDIILRPCEA